MSKDRYAKLNAKIKQEKAEGLSQAERDRRNAEKIKLKEEKQKNIIPFSDIISNELLLDDEDQEYYMRNDYLEQNRYKIWNKNYKKITYVSDSLMETMSTHKEKEWYNRYLYAVEIFKKNNREKSYRVDKHDDNYTETHHIVPRCMGGSDSYSNLVEVSWNEHALLHVLLCRSFPYNNQLYTAVMRILYGSNPNENELFLENYHPELRKEKMESLLEIFIKEKVINKHIYYIH